MIVSFTGHRPQKLSVGHKVIKNELIRLLNELKPEKAISGMALGVDQWAVEVCIELQIPFIAAVPFKGQELYWPSDARAKYFELLAHADTVEYVNLGGFASWKFQARNQFMVKNSDILIAVYDGKLASGTRNCVEFAESEKKKIILIDPNQLK